MAGLRIHTVMSQGLVDRIDSAASSLAVSRGEFVRRAVEQALGSPGSPDAVAGVRGRVPAPVPAEQPGGCRVVDEGVSVVPVIPPGCEPVIPVSSPRVRSSAAARPFRPAPKKGEK